MAINNGNNATDEIINDAQQVEEAAKTAKRAVKNAKKTVQNVKKGAKAAGKAVKAAGHILKFLLTPPVVFITAIVFLALLVGALFNALNPFSTTNSPGGDNAEAQENDIAEDRGVDPDSVDDELMLNYPMDDEEDKDGNKVTGQYTRMASLLYSGINEAYGRSASKYATEKANYANDPQYKTHDNATSVYKKKSGDDSYYLKAENLNQWSTEVNCKEPQELEGDAWDDNDYLTDQSQGGAVEQGIAYIIAAYSVSRGNTAPVAVEGGKNKYTYYNGLKALLKKDNVLDGFFEYTGGLNSVVKTSTVSIKIIDKVEHTRYETTQNTCPTCTAGKEDQRGYHVTAKTRPKEYNEWGEWLPSEENYGYPYATPPSDTNLTQYKSMGVNGGNPPLPLYKKRTRTVKEWETYYVCNAGHEFTSVSQLIKAAYPDWKWEVVETKNQDFEYIQNSYKGNIAKFNDQAILEAMFLDDNDFYKDVQGQMATGMPMGGAASITAGESILIPDGLGTFFSYMAWQSITSPSSNQYKLREDAGMNFNDQGFGIINGRYVIACTLKYGNVGDYVDFYLDNGKVLNCIIGDIKNQSDPGCTEWGHKNGQCVIEFIKDKNTPWPDNPHMWHPDLIGRRVVKAVNGGNYFTNPDFVKDIKDTGTTPDGGSGDSSDLQLKVANIAVNSAKNGPGAVYGQVNMCAGWVGDVYNAAGVNFTRQESAIDWWYKWGNPSQATASNIPVGAAVVGSGSNSAMGQAHGHIGIYVGDVDGDGKGDVVHNIGNPVPVLCSLESWIAARANTVTKKHNQNYQGYQGWVWPDGNALGDGVEFTGVDVSNLSYGNMNPANLSRAQRLANILASDYYQWGVYYKYTCDHEKSKETKCPECGADIKIKKEKFLFFTTNRVPDFEYVKNEFPDFLGKLKENSGEGESMIDESDVYTVKEKIEYYQKDILDSITVAKQYESNTAGGPAGNGGVNPGVGAGNVGGNVGYSGNGSADAAPYMFTNPQNKREEMVNFALSFVGQPYVWGGKDPHTGADCSGFVAYVLNHFGYSATSYTGALVNEGVGISYSDIKPGDIILYTPGNNHHVAMYIGNGRIVHASNSAPYPSGGIKITGNALYEAPLAIRRFIQD